MDKSLEKKYNYWQWRTLIILMIGYALFYFVRKNFSIVMPVLESQLGLSKTSLGIFLTLNGVIYGLSRFLNGFLADRLSRRRLMGWGLLLSASVNIILGFLPEMNGLFHYMNAEGKATIGFAYVVGSLWLINGYLQGMGFPPCASLMAHWIRPSELATKQSIWNASHSIGAGLVSFLIGFILSNFGHEAWQWCFFAPAILAIFVSLLIFWGLRETPASVGLPSPEDMDKAQGKELHEVKVHEEKISDKLYKTLLSKMVFRNPVIWILALTNFCVYIIRLTMLDWGSTILSQAKGMEVNDAATVVGAMEIFGGILGTLVAGWATDKFFKSRAQRTALIFLLASTLCFFLFWKTPASNVGVCVVLIILTSFFIYGPQALLGIATSNQSTKNVAAVANGLVGIFGYLAPIVSGVVFGSIADKQGWDGVFLASVVIGLVGALILALIWNASADGYAKAKKIEEEFNAASGK